MRGGTIGSTPTLLPWYDSLPTAYLKIGGVQPPIKAPAGAVGRGAMERINVSSKRDGVWWI